MESESQEDDAQNVGDLRRQKRIESFTALKEKQLQLEKLISNVKKLVPYK